MSDVPARSSMEEIREAFREVVETQAIMGRTQAAKIVGAAIDELEASRREVPRLRDLLVLWCHAEGGADQERLFEDTMAVLDPDDTGHALASGEG